MKIEVFYIDGCPNHQSAVDRVNQVLNDLGLTADVMNIRVIDSKSAVATRFLGSPTVRVNGIDVERPAQSSNRVDVPNLSGWITARRRPPNGADSPSITGRHWSMTDMTALNRVELIQRGRRLEYFTIGWNSLEGLVSIAAGAVAGSVSLIGFGLDSLIEVTSGAALLWRLHADLQVSRREEIERRTLRIVGLCFLTLAAYIGFDSLVSLIRHEAPERSLTGIVIAALSLCVMPLLAKAKRRVAVGIGSAAMHADSRQTDFCTYLSAILLGGLALNAAFGLWWADPVAGLVMVPIIGKEGMNGLKAKSCCGGGACC